MTGRLGIGRAVKLPANTAILPNRSGDAPYRQGVFELAFCRRIWSLIGSKCAARRPTRASIL